MLDHYNNYLPSRTITLNASDFCSIFSFIVWNLAFSLDSSEGEEMFDKSVSAAWDFETNQLFTSFKPAETCDKYQVFKYVKTQQTNKTYKINCNCWYILFLKLRYGNGVTDTSCEYILTLSYQKYKDFIKLITIQFIP